MTALLTLASGDTSATVSALTGGAIATLQWRGIDLLRPGAADATVRQMGMFVMVPYSNRIGHGRLPGEAPLPANFPGEPHSIHGFGWQRPWQATQEGAGSVRLDLAHAADSHWPFACHATQHIALQADGARLVLSVKNTDTRAMPAGLGFHPFFPVDEHTRLQADWSGRWELGDDHLPTHLAPLSARDDFSAPRDVSGWRVDNCFSGWRGRVTLHYARHSMRIEAGPECPHIVCFRPDDGRAFVALEPVSHISNAHQLAHGGVAGTGLRTLAPGQTFSIHMAIRAMATMRAS